jgi:hypothetical protein
VRVWPCRPRHTGAGTDLPGKARPHHRTVCARRPDRRGGAALFRAVAATLRPQRIRRKQARRFGNHRDRGDGARPPRRPHAHDRQHLDQRVDAGPAREKTEARLRARRADRRAARRRTGVLSRHHDELPAAHLRRISRLCQGASGQGSLRQRRRRQLSANQYRNPRETRRSRPPAHSVQGRRRRDPARPRQRRYPGVVVQHHHPAGHDESGPRARARGGRRRAAAATCRRAHAGRGRISRHAGGAMGGGLRAGRGAGRDHRHATHGVRRRHERARDAGGIRPRRHARAAAIRARRRPRLAAGGNGELVVEE